MVGLSGWNEIRLGRGESGIWLGMCLEDNNWIGQIRERGIKLLRCSAPIAMIGFWCDESLSNSRGTCDSVPIAFADDDAS